MDPLIQAAIEAAKAGDKNRAQGYLKQLLTANPNHIEGWLVMAVLLDNPERKRQCLNRALQLDPANQIARNELLKLDRAATGGSVPVPAAQPSEKPAPQQPAWYQPDTPVAPTRVMPAPQPKPVSQPAPAKMLNKTLVFTYPFWMRILVYVFSALFWLVTILVLIASPAAALIPGFLSLVALGSIWAVSAKVEVGDQGVRSSRLLTGSAQIAWSEIAKFESNATSQNLTLTGKGGRKVKITSQVGGYGQIVELLRRKRPDLFGGQALSDGYTASAGYRPAFTGKKEFKRSLTGVIFGYLFGILCIGGGIWGLVANLRENWLGALIFFFFGLGLIGMTMFGIQGVIVEPGQLTITGAFNDEQLTPRQIRDISLKTIRGRRGRVTHVVVIKRSEGSDISLSGLEGGPELLYGTLMNWWQGGSSSASGATR